MSWDINISTIDNHLFANIKMEGGTHIVACTFVKLGDLLSHFNITTNQIKDPNPPYDSYRDGDLILLAHASHSGNPANTAVLPINRIYDDTYSSQSICMVIIQNQAGSNYPIRRVKRTSNRVSNGYPKNGRFPIL